MFNKKIFEVYLKQEGEECSICTEINAKLDADGLIMENELEEIKNITLNICKRVNIKNRDDEDKIPSEFN